MVSFHYVEIPQIMAYIIIMTIQQTVEIPADRRVTFDLPETIPAGLARFSITVEPDADGISDQETQSIIARARRGELSPSPDDAARFFGCFKGNAPWKGDAVAAIRNMRDEW